VRSSLGRTDPKLRELVPADIADLAPVADQLTGYDACFFCLGVSSAGMSEEKYRRITYDLTLAAAGVLERANPGMVFIYVSGAGTNATGRAMWAQVKGATENALLATSGLRAYMFRPGLIQAVHGAAPRVPLYRVILTILWPLFPVARRIWPNSVTTTELIGKAMIETVVQTPAQHIMDPVDINRLAAGTPA
jgi:uncharacterized protein YbjT (DUF2867 family)